MATLYILHHAREWGVINILIQMVIMKTIIKVLFDQPTPIALFVRSEALYNMCEVTDTMTMRRLTMRKMMRMATMVVVLMVLLRVVSFEVVKVV